MKTEKTYELDCFYCGGSFGNEYHSCNWCDIKGKWKAKQSTIDELYEIERRWIDIY